jgi:Chromate transporter
VIETNSQPTVRIRDLVFYYLRLGTLGFGGPVALCGQMERELVQERKWLSRDEMRDVIAVCQSLWRGTTLAIDIRNRKVVGRWPNGCKGSRGIATDEKRGFLFAGCYEGKVNVLDLKSGRLLGAASSGAGVDVIAYDQKLAHVYLPSADSGTMAIVGISSSGSVTVLNTSKTVEGAHCATVDDRDQVYVCDPAHGKILVFKDSLPLLK